MATTKTVEFLVTGRGSFPIDMLRYDRCSPKSEFDSGEIERSFQPRSHRATRLVALIGATEPTVGRWESFGWKVENS
jgi:hypothetical protein